MIGEVEPPLCINCKHLSPDNWSCAAFTEQIPDEVVASIWDHRKPIDGDHGIQYEPINPDFPLPSALGKGGKLEKDLQEI